jgi:predicted HD phosphohydrolase
MIASTTPTTSHAATTTAATFTSMDISTKEEWLNIGAETAKNQTRVADRIIMLLESLSTITDGFVTDQLTHCLQTATLAERAGADDEVVIASLCHDIGKAISVPNHPAIAASILKPYVRPEVHFMIEAHQDFQGKHYYAHFGMDANARDKYADHPSFDLAAQFADEWDQKAFDPAYDTLPLEHFETKLRSVFAKPRSIVTG